MNLPNPALQAPTATFDVIVIGAGPSGSTTAIQLAKAGYKVALVDKQTFPRLKPCGDGYSARVVEFLDILGVKPDFERGKANRIRRVRVRMLGTSSGYEVEIVPRPGAGYVFTEPRYVFDARLVKRAVECGATFIRGKFAQLVRNGGQVEGAAIEMDGTRLTLKGRVLIGADGSKSAVARDLSGENVPVADRSVAMRGYVAGMDVDPETLEFFYSASIFPGYAWVFPNGTASANVGVGYDMTEANVANNNINRLFEDFLASPEIQPRLHGASAQSVGGALINLGKNRPKRRVFDGALLVGEAARVANPLIGAGICSGMASGMLAAKAVDEALRRNDCTRWGLANYESMLRREIFRELRYSNLAHRLFYSSPKVLQFAVEHLSKTQLVSRAAASVYKDVGFRITKLKS